MGNIEKYAPGAFCWAELRTTDAAGAKKFYGDLFGYGCTDVPMGEMGSYHMFKLAGRDACDRKREEEWRRQRLFYLAALTGPSRAPPSACMLGGKQWQSHGLYHHRQKCDWYRVPSEGLGCGSYQKGSRAHGRRARRCENYCPRRTSLRSRRI